MVSFSGHLNLGNIFLQGNLVEVSDIENFILGVPSQYRSYITEHRRCNVS